MMYILLKQRHYLLRLSIQKINVTNNGNTNNVKGPKFPDFMDFFQSRALKFNTLK